MASLADLQEPATFSRNFVRENRCSPAWQRRADSRKAGSTVLCVLVLAAATFSPAAPAFDFLLEDQVLLTDIDADTDDGRLGRSVAISDDLVILGAPLKDGQDGAAYLYRIDSSRDLQPVRDFVPEPDPRRYAQGMVIDGNLLAIGSDGGPRVPIQIYQRSGNDYVLIKTLDAPDLRDQGVTIRGFGDAIDLEDGFLIVGDSSANVDGVGNAGVALVFRQNAGGANNWGLEGVLKNPSADGSFGRTVAVGNDIAVVGDDVDERAVLFERDALSWTFSRLLQPLNPQPGDFFGSSVAAEGDIVAVGARGGNNAQQPSNSGSVHIFERDAGGEDQFGQVAELVGSEAEFLDGFGDSMRIRDGVLAVGSPGANRAYLFAVNRSIDTWREVAIVAPPPVPFGNVDFGSSVDYFRGSIIVGADTWNDLAGNGTRFGAAFLYENEIIRRCGSFDVIFCDTFEGP